jgi:CheY-like chemotaxis protein
MVDHQIISAVKEKIRESFMKNKKVLIVDDDTSVRGLLRILLEVDGVGVVIEASNGLVALEKASSEKPDLILLDVMMPLMSGIEVLHRLKGEPTTAKIPVIMLTAMRNQIILEQAKAAGALFLLTKPLSPGKLSAKIREALGAK